MWSPCQQMAIRLWSVIKFETLVDHGASPSHQKNSLLEFTSNESFFLRVHCSDKVKRLFFLAAFRGLDVKEKKLHWYRERTLKDTTAEEVQGRWWHWLEKKRSIKSSSCLGWIGRHVKIRKRRIDEEKTELENAKKMHSWKTGVRKRGEQEAVVSKPVYGV